jgi:hypothetical protein
MTLRISGVLDFVHRTELKKLENITFQKLDMFRRMVSSGLLRRVALVRTDVSYFFAAYFGC